MKFRAPSSGFSVVHAVQVPSSISVSLLFSYFSISVSLLFICCKTNHQNMSLCNYRALLFQLPFSRSCLCHSLGSQDIFTHTYKKKNNYYIPHPKLNCSQEFHLSICFRGWVFFFSSSAAFSLLFTHGALFPIYFPHPPLFVLP